VIKTAASAAQLAKCILLQLIHVQLLAPSCAKTNKNFIQLINKMAYWHNSNFGYKLRTD